MLSSKKVFIHNHSFSARSRDPEIAHSFPSYNPLSTIYDLCLAISDFLFPTCDFLLPPRCLLLAPSHFVPTCSHMLPADDCLLLAAFYFLLPSYLYTSCDFQFPTSCAPTPVCYFSFQLATTTILLSTDCFLLINRFLLPPPLY